MSRPTRSSRQRVSSIGRRRRLQLESLERRQLLAADLLFADSFEVASEWSGKWVQDSQNDWFRSTQRKTDGSRSAEVDGSANNAILTLKNAIDLSDYSSAELTFSWFIESNWDTGEYIAIDVFNGSWQEVDRLRGNVDAENTWHHETVSLENYLSAGFLLRFRASVSDSAEDGNVDNVKIVGTLAGPPEISISDATASEGNSGMKFLDHFIPDQGLPQTFRGLAFGPDGNGDGAEDLYVVSSGTDEVLRFDALSGTLIDSFLKPSVSGVDNPIDDPLDLTFGPDGNLYVTSRGTDANPDNNQVLRFDGQTGNFIDVFATGLQRAISIDFGDDGNLYVGNRETNAVQRFNGNGASLGNFIENAAGSEGALRQVVFGADLTDDGKRDVYVVNNQTAEIYRYNAIDGSLIDTIALPSSYGNLTWLEVAGNGSMYASLRQETGMSVIHRLDSGNGESLDAFALGRDGWSMLIDDNDMLYVSGNGAGPLVDRIVPASMAAFTVNLSSASVAPISLAYDTSSNSAITGSDFVATSGTLIFEPGVTSRTIIVPTIDDAHLEGTETFFVNLSNPVGATLLQSQAVGTVVDNDALVTISYPDFSDTTTLNFVADASAPYGVSNSLLLTPQELRYRGAAWHEVPQVVAVSFETEFEFRVDADGANGFAFVIQNDSAGAFGGFAGGIGYTGVPNSLAIEFDTAQSADDPDDNHIAIHSNGVDANSNDLNSTLAIASPTFNINDGQSHHVRVSYVPGLLSVYLDHESAPTLSANVDFAELLNLNAGRAWLGFTGDSGTGQSQEILNWTFSSRADTSTSISISDTQLVEGDSGSSNMLFTVTRAGDLSNASSVSWTTLDGSATIIGNDYISNSGQLEFAPGEEVKTISIIVNGDDVEESHELFFVRISEAMGAFMGDSLASGMILNDDLTVSVAGATALEGGQGITFLGEFARASTPPLLASARGMIFGPDGNLYVARGYREVVRFDGATGAPLGVFAAAQELAGTRDIAFGPDGNLYVTDNVQSSVIRFDGTTGEFIDVFVASRAGGLDTPRGLAFGPEGDLYVASGESHEIMQYDGASGSFVRTFVTAGSGGLNAPQALTFHDGYLYASSGPYQTASILRYDAATGAFVDAFVPAGTAGLTVVVSGGLTFGPDVNGDGTSDLWASSGLSDEVLVFDGATGQYVQTAASPASGGLDGPAGLAFGPDDNLYVVGTQNRSILRYGVESQAGFTVNLSSPSGVPVSVDYTTVNNTATAGSDYVATSGTLVFEPGVTSRTIIVATIDDNVHEGTEAFFVNLSNASGGEIVNSQGMGTILDDDPSQPPTANSDSYNTAEDNPLIVPASGVLANDTDPENDLLTAVLVTTTSHGALTLNANGSFSYSPHNNFFGSDSFSYRANDGTSDSNLATVTISVTPVNDAPVAAADSYTVDQDAVLSIAAQGVLSNDSDVDGDTLTAITWSGNSAQGGQVVLNSNGSFTYTPPAGFSGTDTFSYRASDGSLASDWATVSIAVEADNVNAMYVYDIRFESRYWGLQRRAVFEIRWDSNGDGQGGSADARRAGVSITVEFAGQTYSGTTDANGLFRTSWIGNPGSGTYAEVVDMALVDFVWNPLALDLEDDTDGDGRPDAQL